MFITLPQNSALNLNAPQSNGKKLCFSMLMKLILNSSNITSHLNHALNYAHQKMQIQKKLKNYLLASSCQNGFLEINSFSENPQIEIILIETGKELEIIDFSNLKKINRILIYDFEKNNLKCQFKKSTPPEGEKIQRKLFNLIADYFEKNVSAKIIWDLPLDRDAIFREHATPETLEKTFSAIKKAIEKIKLNQKEHKEKIKELISIFYSENYNELEKLNLTTTIEKLYAQL